MSGRAAQRRYHLAVGDSIIETIVSPLRGFTKIWGVPFRGLSPHG
jgi:hypothetical protein